MNESRTKNSLNNVIINNIFQILNLLMNFIVRTIFIKTLGNNYLGINGLFTNILSILSLAELGIGTAMVYSMYKPLAEKNEKKLSALITYYKKLYTRIALIVLSLGILLLPALKYIIDVDINIKNVYIYYLLYLTSSVCSYLLLYKTSIIIASQKEYLIKKYDIYFLIIRNILQAIILIVFKSYILYLIIQIVTTIMTNILKSKKAEIIFPYINEKVDLEKNEKVEIWKNIKSLLFYQVGNVILNNTDNILISIICGTIYVGFYSNYSMIIMAVAGFTSLIFTSIQASIGNFNIDGSKEGKYNLYKSLNYLSFIVYGFCTITLTLLLNDFITLWIGANYCLDINTTIIIVLNYYITGVLYPNWCFRYTTNLFDKAKFAILGCAICNIILSIIFGVNFGLIGIIGATILARLFTTFWYEPYIMYKNIFEKNVFTYFAKQLLYFGIIVVTLIGLLLLFNVVIIDNIFIRMIVKEIVWILVFFIIFIFPFKNTKEFEFLYSKIKNIIHK